MLTENLNIKYFTNVDRIQDFEKLTQKKSDSKDNFLCHNNYN